MKKIVLLTVLTLMTALASQAQMAKFRSLYLFQFARNVSWPAEDNGRDIVITVIGDKDVSRELATMTKGKMVGTRKILVIEAASATGLRQSDIIYLGEAKKTQLAQLISAQESNKVLIVSGAPGMCPEGAGISFIAEKGQLLYEISSANIEKHNLKVAQKLVTMGRSVY